MDRIHLVQNRTQRQVPVNSIMNFQFHKTWEISWLAEWLLETFCSINGSLFTGETHQTQWEIPMHYYILQNPVLTKQYHSLFPSSMPGFYIFLLSIRNNYCLLYGLTLYRSHRLWTAPVSPVHVLWKSTHTEIALEPK